MLGWVSAQFEHQSQNQHGQQGSHTSPSRYLALKATRRSSKAYGNLWGGKPEQPIMPVWLLGMSALLGLT